MMDSYASLEKGFQSPTVRNICAIMYNGWKDRSELRSPNLDGFRLLENKNFCCINLFIYYK